MCHGRGSGICHLPSGRVTSSRKELWIPLRLGDETAHNFRFYARSRKPANGKLRTTASGRERKNLSVRTQILMRANFATICRGLTTSGSGAFDCQHSTATVGSSRWHALTCCDLANLIFESAASSDRENRKGSWKRECTKAFRRRLRLSASSHFACSRFPRPVSHLRHCTTMFVAR
jgi:hypothetical protein